MERNIRVHVCGWAICYRQHHRLSGTAQLQEEDIKKEIDKGEREKERTKKKYETKKENL